MTHRLPKTLLRETFVCNFVLHTGLGPYFKAYQCTAQDYSSSATDNNIVLLMHVSNNFRSRQFTELC